MATGTKENKKAQGQPEQEEAKLKQEEAKPKQEEAKPKQEAPQAAEPQKAKSVEVSGKLAQLIQAIEGMTVLELSQLVKALEEKFGVSAAVPMAVAGGGGAAAGAAAGEPAEEKTTFDCILKEVGANKIQVIKELRTVTTLGLKEAKDLVEAAPKPIKTGASKEEAETIKKKLEAAGAKVELK